jgi:hypothetical protein
MASPAALPHVSLPVADVLSRASGVLPAAELGALAGTLADACGCARGARALLFLASFGLWPRLRDGEFVAGFGARRLPAARLLRLAARAAAAGAAGAGASPAAAALAAARALLSLHGAGALDAADLVSPRALAALHGVAAGWPEAGGARTRAAAHLLRGLVGEMESFAAAGAFLAALFAAPECALAPAAQRDVLAEVCACDDVRDLAGSPRALMDALPAHAAAIAVALADGAHDSDADEEGNLAGFVDDSIVFSSGSSSPSSDEASASDGSGSSSDSSESSGSRGGRGGGRGRGAAASPDSAPVVGHKRSRPAAARPPPPHYPSSRYVDAEARR